MKKRLLLFISFILLGCTASLAQNITVRGTVKDQKGESLPGVSLKVKGSTQGTSTGVNGDYTINVPGNGILVVSYVGFKTMEVPVNNRTTINLTLSESNQQLDEVVVVGYGTQRRGDVTTAISSVSTKDIEERPIVQAAQALQGKAAGVQVSQPSGKPGQGLSIRVRGATSIQAGNEPLYVIDGVPTMDSRDLNVNDIASIQVLKDASSAAIYGARAANGVVIITTKRGKANASNINFSAYYGTSELAKNIEVLNADQYKTLLTELDPTSVQNLSSSEVTDWTKEVFGTGHNQNYQLSFQGGTDKSQYFVSGAITKDEGIVKPARYNRYSFRANLDNQVKDWFKITSNISYSNANIRDVKDNDNAGRNAVVLGALGTPPNIGIYTTDDKGRTIYTQNPNKSGWDNPLAAIYGPTQGTLDNRIFGNVTGELSVLKDLKLKSNFGIDYFNHKWDYYLDPVMTTEGRNDGNHGLARSDKSNNFTYLWENTVNYEKKWDKHSVSALGGMTIQKNKYNQSYIEGKDFPDDNTVKTINAANIISNAYTNESAWFLNSYLARVMYNFDSRYLVTVNFRADGSSKLDKNNQWGYFPSVSAGWRISSEPFFKVKAINDLKLRLGWGQNGNVEGLSNYASLGLNTFTRHSYESGEKYRGPNINPPTKMPNPDLKWETSTQSNIGIDVAFLNSRLTFTADAYIKKTKDLILTVALPDASSYRDGIDRNSGKLENKGLEFLISSVNIDRPGFKWNTDVNLSLNRNKITELQLQGLYRYAAVEGRDYIIALEKGVSLGSFYGYVAEGVNPETGNMEFKDLNNDGSITPGDRTYIGSAQPKFIYGLNNDLTYKNWNFSFLFQGSQGNKIFNASRIETEGMYDTKNQSTEVLRRWTENNRNTDIPKADFGQVSNSRVSSRFVENGSFLRMKSATLSYNFEKSLINRLKMNKLTVYFTAQNLFTITNYKGFDPELNAFASSNDNRPTGTTLGIDYGTYPSARTFILGVNVTL